jgi:hypothetical protein
MQPVAALACAAGPRFISANFRRAMSSDDEALKRRYREFLDLMPLTIALAGLSQNEGQRNFTTDQIEIRAQVVINAFRIARQAVREAIKS